jgi:hypothetical protein
MMKRATAASFLAHPLPPGGRLSLRDWQDLDWRSLIARDADRDGRISETEFTDDLCRNGRARCLYRANFLFLSLDRNRNGYLDRGEAAVWSESLFRHNDLNHDGWVTQQEMDEAAARLRPRS